MRHATPSRAAAARLALLWSVAVLVLSSACAGTVGTHVAHPGTEAPPGPEILLAVFSGTLHDALSGHYRHDLEAILYGPDDGPAAESPPLPPPETVRIVDMLYPSVGRANRNFHAAQRARTTVYLDAIEPFLAPPAAAPGAEPAKDRRLVLFGFSQGGCIALGELLRLATHERADDLLARTSVVLVAPAGDVISPLAVARRMENTCRELDARLTALAYESPALRRLLRERVWIRWGSNLRGGAHDGLIRHHRGSHSRNLTGIRSFVDQAHEASFRWVPNPRRPKRQRSVRHGQWVRPRVVPARKRAAIRDELHRTLHEALTAPYARP